MLVCSTSAAAASNWVNSIHTIRIINFFQPSTSYCECPAIVCARFSKFFVDNWSIWFSYMRVYFSMNVIIFFSCINVMRLGIVAHMFLYYQTMMTDEFGVLQE
jgi:hypothetical protein